MNPLYWKWIWSIMKRPGERRIEREATCAACLLGKGTDLTNLSPSTVNTAQHIMGEGVVPAQREDQDQLGQDDCRSLEVDGLPRIIAQVFHNQHRRVNRCSRLRHQPFEGCEEWGVVEGPFRGFLDDR